MPKLNAWKERRKPTGQSRKPSVSNKRRLIKSASNSKENSKKKRDTKPGRRRKPSVRLPNWRSKKRKPMVMKMAKLLWRMKDRCSSNRSK